MLASPDEDEEWVGSTSIWVHLPATLITIPTLLPAY